MRSASAGTEIVRSTVVGPLPALKRPRNSVRNGSASRVSVVFHPVVSESSKSWNSPSAVTTAASLTGVTFTVTSDDVVPPSPSVSVIVTVRDVDVGSSPVWMNPMPRSTARTASASASALNVMTRGSDSSRPPAIDPTRVPSCSNPTSATEPSNVVRVFPWR